MTRTAHQALFSALLLLAATRASGQQPALRYDPARAFSGGTDGDDGARVWIADTRDGMLAVYPFRPFRGDLERDFRQTLFADRVAVAHREDRVLPTPAFAKPAVGGADAAILAQFTDYNRGAPRTRARVAILAGGSVAIVDLSASSMAAFQRHLQNVTPLLSSLRVVRESDVAPAPAAVGGPIAGLYVAAKRMFRLSPTGSPGSGSWETKNEWFLLSDDGRVQRGIDLPSAPNGDIRRFDYEAARRSEPGNGGTYTTRGGTVAIRLGGGDSFDGTMDAQGSLVINGTTYKRAQLR
jgi:hypothetical protein